DDRRCSRETDAGRASVRVGGVAERQLAPAEHLRPRPKLDVDLETDHRFVAHPLRAGLESKLIAFSSAYAASSSRGSLNAGPASWKPTGSRSLSPEGIEIAGMPASGIGTVQKSLRYIASGS